MKKEDVVNRNIKEQDSKQAKQDAELYSSIIQNSLEGFWLIDISGKIIDVNETACKMLGYFKEELVGMAVSEITTYKNTAAVNKQIESTLKLKKEKFYSKHTRKDQHIIDVEVCTSSYSKNEKGVIVAFIRDISHEIVTNKILNKRIELLEYSSNHEVKKTMQKALDFAEELTNSEISFWHHISDDMNNILLQQWSTNTIGINCTAEAHSHHANIKDAGIWADCIRLKKTVVHNDYKNVKHKKGLPEGHADMTRQLIVPVIKENEIVAIIGVGNKKTNYVEDDIRVMETFGNVAWTIYEKQFTSETLVKSENKNKAILGLLPDLLFEFSLVGDFLNYHASDYSKLFLKPKQFLGKNIFDVLTINTAKLIQSNIDKAFKTEEMVSFEYSSFVEETYQYFAVRVVKFTQNSVLCFMRDITDKQVAKELIIESEEKFSAVFFNSPLIKTITDIKTEKLVDINKKFLEITGFSKEDTLGRTASEIGLLSYSEKKKILTELDKNGKVRDLQVEYTKKEGQKIICNYSSELVKISGKVFLLTIAQDITEKRKIERELELHRNDLESKVEERTKQLTELNYQLESHVEKLKESEKTVQDSLKKAKELNDLKSQFVSMASDEFRVPLTEILNSVELIEKDLSENKNDKVLVNSQKIQSSIHNMLALIEKVVSSVKDKK